MEASSYGEGRRNLLRGVEWTWFCLLKLQWQNDIQLLSRRAKRGLHSPRMETDTYRLVRVRKGRRNLQWGVEWTWFCLLSSCRARLDIQLLSRGGGGEQRGVCTRQPIKCDTCKCQSKPYKVYKETEIDTWTTQGRHLTQPNITQYVGLTEMPVSSTSVLRLLCSCLNIPSPSVNGCQETRNKVADTIVYSDNSDMNTKQEELQEKLIVTGGDFNVVSIEYEGMYNNAKMCWLCC